MHTQSCPNEKDITAFIDGVLATEEHNKIANHLKDCFDCYLTCTVVSSSLRKLEKTKLHKRYFTTALSSLAVIAVVCSIMIFPFTKRPNLNKLITSIFTENIVKRISEEDLELNGLLLPWERESTPPLGFKPLPDSAMSKRAFAAGLFFTRQKLVNNRKFKPPKDILVKQWDNSTWAVSFWFGKWSYLLRAVALGDNEISHEFWQNQLIILNQIKKEYEKNLKENESTFKSISTQIKNIRLILNNLNQESSSQKYRIDLILEFNKAINTVFQFVEFK